jgi:hypothetical protein
MIEDEERKENKSRENKNIDFFSKSTISTAYFDSIHILYA